MGRENALSWLACQDQEREKSTVSECTFYEDRRLAIKREMEEIAWILRTDMPRRRVGFISPEQLREIEAEAAVLSAASDKPKLNE